MWILSFFPDWIFHAIVIAGLLAVIVGTFLKSIPIINKYALLLKIVGYFVLALGIFLEGGIHTERIWQARVKEVEAKTPRRPNAKNSSTAVAYCKYINC